MVFYHHLTVHLALKKVCRNESTYTWLDDKQWLLFCSIKNGTILKNVRNTTNMPQSITDILSPFPCVHLEVQISGE